MTEAQLLAAGFKRTSDAAVRMQRWSRFDGTGDHVESLLWDSVGESEYEWPGGPTALLMVQQSQLVQLSASVIGDEASNSMLSSLRDLTPQERTAATRNTLGSFPTRQ